MSTWTAKIPREQMAVKLMDDLSKKFRQLNAMPSDQYKQIAEGLVDGLMGTSFEYPNSPLIPDYLRSMDPNYCAGHQVGTTWRKIAKEWPQE